MKDLGQQRINGHLCYVVEMDDDEVVAYDRYDDMLDKGHGIPLAAKVGLQRMIAVTGTFPSDEFIKWLSEDTCIRWGSRIRRRPLGGPAPLIPRRWRSLGGGKWFAGVSGRS